MNSGNRGCMRQQSYGRRTAQQKGDTRGFYQPRYAESVCPLPEHGENDDYLKYEESYMGYEDYEEYDDIGGWHGGRARDDCFRPTCRGYGSVDGIGQGSSHLVDDREWPGHSYYDPLHRGSTSYEMKHKRTKYSVLQVHQREGRCQGDAPWPVYKQRKDGPAERSKMIGRKVGIQQKRRQDILTLRRTSIDILVEDSKSKKLDVSTMILESEHQLNRLQKLEMEIKEMKAKLEAMSCKSCSKDSASEKKIVELNNQLQEKMDEMDFVESSNQMLVIKERESNDQLQEIRRELINGLLEHGGPRAHIGIKRMGDLDPKAFSNACKQIFSGDNAEVNAALLCSKWEAEIKKNRMAPF